jgi:hypothetical protein
MSQPKKKVTINLDSAYEVHALLEYMLVSTVVENQQMFKRLSLPYYAVVEPNEKYKGAQLVVEICTYWDTKRSERERKNGPEITSKTKTRH